MRPPGAHAAALRIAVLLGTVAVAGCVTQPTSPLEREIAARCAPVRGLLSKNRERGAHAKFFGLDIGGLEREEGAKLSPRDTQRVLLAYQLCTDWVKGDLKGPEYSKAMPSMVAAFVVENSTSVDREALTAAVIEAAKQARADGALPNSFSTEAVSAKVAKDAKLTPEELEARLNATIRETREQADVLAQPRYEAILSRLDRIESKLKDHQIGSVGGGDTTSAAAPIPSLLEIYFATASSEVERAGRLRLLAAANRWRETQTIVEVRGFADPRGGANANAHLALRRAQSVAGILEAEGIKVVHIRSSEVLPHSGDFESMRMVQIRAR